MAAHPCVVLSNSFDPWLNLAVEDWIFRGGIGGGICGGPVLFLWRNTPTVVIGRFQNPWLECNLPLMDREGVALARRQSGGGAVYHDEGNCNFTFISSAQEYDRDRNFRIVLAALHSLGIPAERTQRNDILVEGRKVSGNAFKHTRERCFHHGTLLVAADLDRLERYLHSAVRATRARGTASVRSMVTNLRDWYPGNHREELTHEKVRSALVDAFLGEHRGGGPAAGHTGHPTAEHPTESNAGYHLFREACAQHSVQEYRAGLQSRDWVFGTTPSFSQEFSFGEVTVDRGVIAAVHPHGADVAELLGVPWGIRGPENAVHRLQALREERNATDHPVWTRRLDRVLQEFRSVITRSHQQQRNMEEES